MIPIDPRRPERVQRYKPPQNNGSAPVEDLTPDYMNILGPDSATANADAAAADSSAKNSELHESVAPVAVSTQDPPQQQQQQQQQPQQQSSNGTNVIPTSPQYGVAIMSNDVPTEASTASTDTVVETTAKSDDSKDMHSTPSRNDRFKVVKIASLEPFRRGRWKCMDYVDENPPPATSQSKTSQTNMMSGTGAGIYMQTQSLPQQHFQQMMQVQGGFNNSPHFYASPMMQQSQYFYAANPNMPMQPQQFANQQYFPPNVVPHSGGFANYNNVQYVPSNLMQQNQTSAFVPTTQNMPPNFQQSQTYAGPPSSAAGSQPVLNGHAFAPPTESAQVVLANSLPTQAAKNVILNTSISPAQITQTNPQTYNQVTNPSYPTGGAAANPLQNIAQQSPSPSVQSAATGSVPLLATSLNQTAPSANLIVPTTATILTQSVTNVNVAHVCYDPNQPTNVYTNPQFVASVNSLPTDGDAAGDNAETETESTVGEDPTKANPVVNAIDNKIEQAMDLVKSHLMYTVREEVEVLKERIAELMERIQQLETENNFLKQQIPKGSNSNPSGTPDPPQ